MKWRLRTPEAQAAPVKRSVRHYERLHDIGPAKTKIDEDQLTECLAVEGQSNPRRGAARFLIALLLSKCAEQQT